MPGNLSSTATKCFQMLDKYFVSKYLFCGGYLSIKVNIKRVTRLNMMYYGIMEWIHSIHYQCCIWTSLLTYSFLMFLLSDSNHLCIGGININNGQLLQSKQRYKWGGRWTLIISKLWYCILTKNKFQNQTQVSKVQEQTICRYRLHNVSIIEVRSDRNSWLI